MNENELTIDLAIFSVNTPIIFLWNFQIIAFFSVITKYFQYLNSLRNRIQIAIIHEKSLMCTTSVAGNIHLHLTEKKQQSHVQAHVSYPHSQNKKKPLTTITNKKNILVEMELFCQNETLDFPGFFPSMLNENPFGNLEGLVYHQCGGR